MHRKLGAARCFSYFEVWCCCWTLKTQTWKQHLKPEEKEIVYACEVRQRGPSILQETANLFTNSMKHLVHIKSTNWFLGTQKFQWINQGNFKIFSRNLIRSREYIQTVNLSIFNPNLKRFSRPDSNFEDNLYASSLILGEHWSLFFFGWYINVLQ